MALETRFERHYTSSAPLEDVLTKTHELLSPTRPTMARQISADGTAHTFTLRKRTAAYGAPQEYWANVLVSERGELVRIAVEYHFARRFLWQKLLTKIFLVFFNLCTVAVIADDIAANGFRLKGNDLIFMYIVGIGFLCASVGYLVQPISPGPEGTRLEQFLIKELNLTRVPMSSQCG